MDLCGQNVAAKFAGNKERKWVRKLGAEGEEGREREKEREREGREESRRKGEEAAAV